MIRLKVHDFRKLLYCSTCLGSSMNLGSSWVKAKHGRVIVRAGFFQSSHYLTYENKGLGSADLNPDMEISVLWPSSMVLGEMSGEMSVEKGDDKNLPRLLTTVVH